MVQRRRGRYEYIYNAVRYSISQLKPQSIASSSTLTTNTRNQHDQIPFQTDSMSNRMRTNNFFLAASAAGLATAQDLATVLWVSAKERCGNRIITMPLLGQGEVFGQLSAASIKYLVSSQYVSWFSEYQSQPFDDEEHCTYFDSERPE